jgi:hypothetical protein
LSSGLAQSLLPLCFSLVVTRPEFVLKIPKKPIVKVEDAEGGLHLRLSAFICGFKPLIFLKVRCYALPFIGIVF